jgi:uncharacterized Tic20 family protein
MVIAVGTAFVILVLYFGGLFLVWWKWFYDSKADRYYNSSTEDYVMFVIAVTISLFVIGGVVTLLAMALHALGVGAVEYPM